VSPVPNPPRWCEARTWQQARAGSWGGSQPSQGCQRPALVRTEDGHWACPQHAARPPANGWN
jgi:hypothetical protein